MWSVTTKPGVKQPYSILFDTAISKEGTKRSIDPVSAKTPRKNNFLGDIPLSIVMRAYKTIPLSQLLRRMISYNFKESNLRRVISHRCFSNHHKCQKQFQSSEAWETLSVHPHSRFGPLVISHFWAASKMPATGSLQNLRPLASHPPPQS